MTRGQDWWGFHVHIDPIDTVDALQTALTDPQQRWYGLRRIAALAASGVVVAASWNPNLHPRGKDGKFIEKFGWVRWFDPDTLNWRTGWVSDINGSDGTITVRSGGEKVSFANATNLYSRPKPKARLDLPDPTDPAKLPDNFTKVGGQGGSNPGALYQIDGSFANGSPDISRNSKMFVSISAFRQPGSENVFGNDWDPSAAAATIVPTDVDTVMVPRVDGTIDRYDVLQRFGNKWYRVPTSGRVTVDDLMRPELEVSAADAFGEPGTLRRHDVVHDLGTVGFTRGAAYDVEDIAAMVQQTGSPLPKVGDKFYVKKMNIPERARSEALANDFYELLGIPVPEVAVGSDGSTVSSKLVGDTITFDANNPDHVKAAQAGFVADAWLANWDVIGMGFDNIQIDAQGRAWRIDAGGALEWRAMGKPKGGMFGDTVTEIDSLRNKQINPTAGKVYGGITDADLVEQALVLQSVSADDIQRLADNHGLGHVGPIMVARRKSILDQLGIVDPPAHVDEPPPPPKTVYNPVEAVQQMGAPPTVAVHNWNLAYNALPSATVDPSEWDQPELLDAVWKRDGDLWTYQSGLEEWGPGGHKANLRNVFTGEVKAFTLYDGEDSYLTGYDKNNVDTLVDNATPTRDLAVAEIVARTTGVPLNGLSYGTVLQPDDPEGFTYHQVGIGNWKALETAWERGRLGKTGPEGAADWPLRNGSDDGLWEVTAFGPDGISLKRRDDGSNVTATLTPNDLKVTGPWFIPGNDTTAAIWKSKYAPVAGENGDQDPGGQKLDEQDKIAAKQADVDDILALLGPDGGVNLPGGDDGASDATGVGEEDQPGLEKVWSYEDQKYLYIPKDKVAAWMAGLWQPGEDPDLATGNIEPTSTQKVVHSVLAGLSPSEPILSTEMAVSDVAALEAQLLNKHVVVLPIEAHDNPDWDAVNLGNANGLGTVTEVTKKQHWVQGSYTGPNGSYVSSHFEDVVALKVTKPYGGFSWVVGGESSKWKKMVVPVETAPAVQQVTFKQDGDIFINGVKVGHYWKPYTHPSGYGHDGYSSYSGVINGDHSLTGKPMSFSASKQTALKNGATSLVVPVPEKPTKPKSTKIHATEQEIKDLNVALATLTTKIETVEIELAEVTKGVPAGEGNPLNDGTKPQKGDWVFSVKDGTYAQVLNPNVVGFAGKGVLSPDMIKVKIQDPVTGKWKQSNRKRDQLVSVAGPGEPPFVLQTKAVKDSQGNWVGPGTTVYVGTLGHNALVLDTTTGGDIKLAKPDGAPLWVTGQYVSAQATGTVPTVKNLPGTASPDALNAELAALQDEKANLAATIANTVVAKPKKKKEIGTPFPGPGGATVKQPKWLAEQREAKGLKNMKDGYVPTTGMILRHNDGTQYVVVEMGDDWSSHKNSVRVVPAGGSSWDAKWRAVSTMVVDHEAMLTDKNGDPLPIVSSVDGADWAPESGMILSKTYMAGYWHKDPVTGKSEYRKTELTKYFIVAYDGAVYAPDGTKVYGGAIAPWQGFERIGYLDKSAVGGKKLTVSVQPHHNAQLGQIEYAVIHDPNEPATIPLAKKVAPVEPQPAPAPPVPPAPAPATPTAPPGSFANPLPAPAPAAPAAPTVPVTVSPTPTDELPVFTGKNPQGMESPHPPTTKSTAGVPVFQAQGGETTLDVAGVPGAHSVVGAIAQTLQVAANNKKNGTKDWVGTYGLADHDVIEDMMVRSQTVRDAQGVEYVEVSFRLESKQARKNHTTFITSSVNEAGDWEMNNRNATNLVPGDLLAVRIASGGGVTPKGALRPDENGTMPNASVIAAPVLIGKNKDGTLDVYRTQVMTAGGDIGYIDLEDRNGTDTVQIATWDPTKPRISNGGKGLNPNAKDDGWSVKTQQLVWDRSGSQHNQIEQDADGVKKVGGYNTTQVGAGWTLERTYQGATVEYRTSADKNSLDGQVMIRVKADDPEAQRKISEAMELVGVTKEKQKPPDKAALVKMATDKVWIQFNPTYTRGKTPNSPDEALKAIDNAVGAQLGRPATMADISLRLTPDGRVQVLVSEDVAKAIVKKNGVKQYTHRFAGGVEDTVIGALTGVNPGLMATTERWAHGYFFYGMSSTQDHGHDSADRLFLRMSNASSIGSGHAIFDPVAIHRHVDYYWQPSDSFGSRQSNQLNWLNSPSPGGSNELMLSRRLDPSVWGNVVVSEPERSQWIKKLHAKGITKAPNGQSLEDFFVVSGSPKTMPPNPNFGDEIPLASLPETLPVPALAGV